MIFFSLVFIGFLRTVIPKSLYYKTNVAGLFSQFIQVKLMYDYAHQFNRALVVEQIKCSHYKSPVLMNDVFDYEGYGITSRKLFPPMKCYNSTRILHPLMGSNTENLCYNGNFPFELTGEATPRYGIIESLGIDVPMKLKKLTLLDTFMNNLGIKPGANFTVAHWRRGDQSVRCNSGMDSSVNCGSGDDFVRKVRQYSSDEVVYVATNERLPMHMVPIHEAKFKTIGSHHFDELTALSLEVELMNRATTFLAWGVSEIDDVVEYERMKAGKSHCVAYEPFVVDRNVTFCYLLKQLHRLPKSTFKPYVVPA